MNKKNNQNFAGFWRRFFAYLIDIIFLFLIGILLHFLFDKLFLTLGENLWYIGFFFFMIYFVPLTSSFGKGQTLGKKILKIRVIDKKGSFLSFKKTFLRYLIIGLIFFREETTTSLINFFGHYSWLLVTKDIITNFFILGIVGLLIFNKEKRGIHDYICGSVVIKSENKKETDSQKIKSLKEIISVHKIGFIIIFILFLLSSLGLILIQINAKEILPENAITLKKSLEENNFASNIKITSQKMTKISLAGEKTKERNLIIDGYIPFYIYENDKTRKEKSEKIKYFILQAYPNISNYDNLIIILRTGYNLGIFKNQIEERKVYSLYKPSTLKLP